MVNPVPSPRAPPAPLSQYFRALQTRYSQLSQQSKISLAVLLLALLASAIAFGSTIRSLQSANTKLIVWESEGGALRHALEDAQELAEACANLTLVHSKAMAERKRLVELRMRYEDDLGHQRLLMEGLKQEKKYLQQGLSDSQSSQEQLTRQTEAHLKESKEILEAMKLSQDELVLLVHHLQSVKEQLEKRGRAFRQEARDKQTRMDRVRTMVLNMLEGHAVISPKQLLPRRPYEGDPGLHSRFTPKCAEAGPPGGQSQPGLDTGVGARRRWISQNAAENDYNHMAMISHAPSACPWNWIAVWQSAQKWEGTQDQHLRSSFSDDTERWTEPVDIPLLTDSPGCVWSPVLHYDDDKDVLWLFFSKSISCLRPPVVSPIVGEQPPRWSPGGSIKFVRSYDGLHWTRPTTIIKQKDEGNIPKVIANQMLVAANGWWLLPYWRERPTVPDTVEGCWTDQAVPASAGVLISQDRGRTWASRGEIFLPNTWLIEGSIVQLSSSSSSAAAVNTSGGSSDSTGAMAGAAPPLMLQYFRTEAGVAYKSTSADSGLTWTTPAPTDIPNPNSKLNLIRLDNGALAMAYNDDSSAGVRNKLVVAASYDNGGSWAKVGVVESDPDNAAAMYHYPTLHQDGCRLLVAYSTLFARWRGPKYPAIQGGIRITHVDMATWPPHAE
eukprot:jgi/Mesvir1/18551/Mv17068-RA.1